MSVMKQCSPGIKLGASPVDVHVQWLYSTSRETALCTSAQVDPRQYQTYLATRPKSFEADAVAVLIDVLRKSQQQPMKPGFRLHIVHLANADLLADIKQAQDEGDQVPESWVAVLMYSHHRCCCCHRGPSSKAVLRSTSGGLIWIFSLRNVTANFSRLVPLPSSNSGAGEHPNSISCSTRCQTG